MKRMAEAWETPWKAGNELRRWVETPWVRLVFAWHGVAWGEGWKLYGAPLIFKHRRSQMQFGPRLSLRSTRRSNPLTPEHPVALCTWQPGARLVVGADFAMTGGGLVCAQEIVIGDRVTVGANTLVVDSDFHPLDPARRLEQPSGGESAPVCIEDDVFIGTRCLVLKGARLGRGCVIGAGSVVVGEIPAGCIAAGNPARVVGAVNGFGERIQRIGSS